MFRRFSRARATRGTALNQYALILALLSVAAFSAVLPFGRALSDSLQATTGAIEGGTGVPVAVAANFTEPAKEIAAGFTKQTGIKVDLTFGSSGTLYTQIKSGAPYQVFLSADNTRNVQAVTEGVGVAGTPFVYAVGKLVLFSATPGLFDLNGQAAGTSILNQTALCPGASCFANITIANPATAPYGLAGQQAMTALGYYATLQPKLVLGSDITLTYNSVNAGAVPLGFVALSQVIDPSTGVIRPQGSSWTVPANLYSPISQGAVLLKTGEGNSAAVKFVEYLKSPAALAVIRRYGYALPGDP